MNGGQTFELGRLSDVALLGRSTLGLLGRLLLVQKGVLFVRALGGGSAALLGSAVTVREVLVHERAVDVSRGGTGVLRRLVAVEGALMATFGLQTVAAEAHLLLVGQTLSRARICD